MTVPSPLVNKALHLKYSISLIPWYFQHFNLSKIRMLVTTAGVLSCQPEVKSTASNICLSIFQSPGGTTTLGQL